MTSPACRLIACHVVTWLRQTCTRGLHICMEGQAVVPETYAIHDPSLQCLRLTPIETNRCCFASNGVTEPRRYRAVEARDRRERPTVHGGASQQNSAATTLELSMPSRSPMTVYQERKIGDGGVPKASKKAILPSEPMELPESHRRVFVKHGSSER